MSPKSEAPQTKTETGPKIPQTPVQKVGVLLPSINAVAAQPLTKTGNRFAEALQNIDERRQEEPAQPLTKTGKRFAEMQENIDERRQEEPAQPLTKTGKRFAEMQENIRRKRAD
jgi:predicted transcriptional regulator